MKKHKKLIVCIVIAALLIGLAVTVYLIKAPQWKAAAELKQLKQQFPTFFDLPTENGLEVYIWDEGKGDYLCQLLPVREQPYTEEELFSPCTTTLETMRVIVDSYLADGVPQSDVAVHFIPRPGSVPEEPYNEYALEAIERLFWSESPAMSLQGYSSIFDTAVFDIDSDGVDEVCSLDRGHTSGLQTFSFIVHEVHRPYSKFEYFNMFLLGYHNITFVKTNRGTKLRVFPERDSADYIDYTIRTKNGNVVLTADGEDLPYWGPCGIESMFAMIYQ